MMPAKLNGPCWGVGPPSANLDTIGMWRGTQGLLANRLYRGTNFGLQCDLARIRIGRNQFIEVAACAF